MSDFGDVFDTVSATIDSASSGVSDFLNSDTANALDQLGIINKDDPFGLTGGDPSSGHFLPPYENPAYPRASAPVMPNPRPATIAPPPSTVAPRKTNFLAWGLGIVGVGILGYLIFSD